MTFQSLAICTISLILCITAVKAFESNVLIKKKNKKKTDEEANWFELLKSITIEVWERYNYVS